MNPAAPICAVVVCDKRVVDRQRPITDNPAAPLNRRLIFENRGVIDRHRSIVLHPSALVGGVVANDTVCYGRRAAIHDSAP